MAPPHFPVTLDVAAKCLGCSHERPVPDRAAVERALETGDDGGHVYLETRDACPHCGSTRLSVRMTTDLA